MTEEEEGKALRARSMLEYDQATKGKPTPTQEEIDLASIGQGTIEHEPDGANLDQGAALVPPAGEAVPPPVVMTPKKQMEAKPAAPAAAYQTRTVTSRTPTPTSGSE